MLVRDGLLVLIRCNSGGVLAAHIILYQLLAACPKLLRPIASIAFYTTNTLLLFITLSITTFFQTLESTNSGL